MKKGIIITVVIIVIIVAIVLIYKKVSGKDILPKKSGVKDTVKLSTDTPIKTSTSPSTAQRSAQPKGTIVDITTAACIGRGGTVVRYSNGNYGCRGGLNA